jgi:Tfp pilus assembly protein PilN
MTRPAEQISWSTATILALISIIAILVGDRVIVAIQIENARTRITALETTLMEVRGRQFKNEERIGALERK